MLLRSIAVSNYKSFLEEQKILIGDRFNVFIGANNSGKTTALEALDLIGGKDAPHRSTWSLPNFGDKPIKGSMLGVEIVTSLAELRRQFGGTINIPIPKNYEDKYNGLRPAQDVYQDIRNSPEVVIWFRFQDGTVTVQVTTCIGETAAVRMDEGFTVLRLRFTDGDELANHAQVVNVVGGIDLLTPFKPLFYRFSAQRHPATRSSYGGTELMADASNLAFCISQLQANDSYGHGVLCKWVNRVFPAVHWVQAPTVGHDHWAIQCLPCSPELRRTDLAVPLQQMGTGIGNVLAILYVVLTARYPQVIAIDEPNSFLHPKALRELLQILANEGERHQYILTAHSADVLTAIEPSSITVFKADSGKTEARQVVAGDYGDLRADLSALGIRMTDLHGRDRVLWVEGQTEELVIPQLLRHFCPDSAAGTAVLRVEHTGKFDRKGVEVKEVASSYARLTSSALVPPMVAVLLDAERRNKAVCARLEKESGGTLRFLPVTMLENYVLDADAIAAVLAGHGEKIDKSAIEAVLSVQVCGDFAELNGAKILGTVFSDLTQARYEFHKTRDVPRLVGWLLDNKPEFLSPLGEFLTKLFPHVQE